MLDTQEAGLEYQVQALLQEGKYDQGIRFCEQAIETEPDVINHYWYLGLAYLLYGQEEAAQTTWLVAMSQGTSEDIDQWSKELGQILDTEAQRQAELDNTQIAYLIRQHLREIAPTEINNLLHLLLLSFSLECFNWQLLKDWDLLEILKQSPSEAVNSEILLEGLKQIIELISDESLDFLAVCLPHARPSETFVKAIVAIAVRISLQNHRPDFAAKLAELCLQLEPDNSGALQQLSCFYTTAGKYQLGIEAAKRFYEKCQTPDWQLLGNYLLLRAMLTAGFWGEVREVIERYELVLLQLIQEQPELDKASNISLIISPFFLPYIEDNPEKSRRLHNQASQLFQKNLRTIYSTSVQFVHSAPSDRSTRPLRIGYVAHTFRMHSVGWLSRWLFHYSDRELFPTNIYCINQDSEDKFNQTWFRNKVNITYHFGFNPLAIATQIKNDDIDILVELDSITLDTTCELMALKPAPLQVSWLGWDAPGLPAIDYFIADPYVLPDNAQDYYQENIWRLPQTYVAVDGFEVGVPTLRREHLEIPADAIIYLSGQKGYKRHPDTVRLQMQILKEVPHSYFIVKGSADESTIRGFFNQIAEEVGVDPGRLRFVFSDPNEFVHRANLAIADIILDTYPFNGATTTLEVLWMGIPLVTRVGQQFAARNSYTFMMNVGVTEGIAWTDEEYVEWGVRLGKDPVLRQQIAWRLRQSRKTAPLWNGQQFTREMEKAYQGMWRRYTGS